MKNRTAILLCCIGMMVFILAGCGNNSKQNTSVEEHIVKENSVNGVKVHVSDWELDDYLCASLTDRMKVKKEITISNGKSYFALISFEGDTRILPVPDGKGKITDEINNKNDFPSKIEIGALFEMEAPNDSGLEISLGNIQNEINEYDSLRDSVYVSAKVTEKSKKSFILFYQIINKKSEIVDYGYRVIENGEGEIWKSITPLEIDEYSVQINGVYVIDGNDIDILKINEDYEWTKSDLDGYYESKQNLICDIADIYGIGMAKEITNGEYSGDKFFYIYNGTGEIAFAEEYDKDKLDEDEINLKQCLPKYSYKITAFSHDCIEPDLYSIEYEDSDFSKNIMDEMEKETSSRIKKEPAIGMTAEQVEVSTWGKPDDINKTTYSWGVKEQWVYSDYRYIYLEDGIVTAITE